MLSPSVWLAPPQPVLTRVGIAVLILTVAAALSIVALAPLEIVMPADNALLLAPQTAPASSAAVMAVAASALLAAHRPQPVILADNVLL